MTGPETRIRDAVSDIQNWLTQIPLPGEAIVRQAIILRLLDAAGFAIWNPLEVVPEETNVTGNRADFLIRAGEGKFALEIKGMNVTLGPTHYQQAATYAVNERTRWAIITNGRVWVVLDEHLPGRWEERIALKLELGGADFAEDLTLLLDLATWQAGEFDKALQAIAERQRWRYNAENTKKEKTPLVEQHQERFGIPSFELAVENAILVGIITESDGRILLGINDFPISKLPEKTTESIGFQFSIKGAEGHLLWDGKDNWTLLKGSTAIDRQEKGPEKLREERSELVERGILRKRDNGLFEFIQDFVCNSPSRAAYHIADGSRNGWVDWLDEEGRPADFYRKNR